MTLEILTLLSDEDGTPRLVDRAVKFRDANQGMANAAARMSNHESCRNFIFVELPVGFSSSFRVADLGQITVCLDGYLEVSTGDGEGREVRAGSVFRLMPGSSSRHRLSVVGETSAHLMIIQTHEDR